MSLPAIPPRQQIVDKINSYLQTNGSITAIEHKEIELLLVDAVYGAQIGDIKEIAANDDYIISNFQTGGSNNEEGKGLASGVNTPLGISTGERYGWAICNGKNGTINKKGKVAIGYDPSLYPLGPVAGNNTGGSKNAVVVSHNHSMLDNRNVLYYDTDGTVAINLRSGSPGWGVSTINVTNSSGESGVDKNMQPYVVTLFIQRIPV